MQKPGCRQVALVGTLDEPERHVPERPVKAKQQTHFEKIHAPAQTVGAVGVPAQFLHEGREKEREPPGEDAGREGSLAGEMELIHAVPEEQGNCLCQKNARKHKKTGKEEIFRLDSGKADEAVFDIAAQVVVRPDHAKGN